MPNAITLYRVSRWLYERRVPFFPKVIQALIFLIYNCKVPFTAKIGKGSFLVVKGVGVVIHGDTLIGNNVRIGIGCKIVGKGPYKNVARIGDDVFIGPGAVIVGPVVVENYALIAANAVVVNSIPEGAIVGGVPAKIIGWVSELNYNVMHNQSDVEGFSEYLV